MKYESFQKAAYSIARKQSGGSYMIDLIACLKCDQKIKIYTFKYHTMVFLREPKLGL